MQEKEEKAVCFEKNAIDHIQRLTHKSFSKMQDTSARIKRNFLIKTKIPVCLRSVFIIRFQAHLWGCIGHSGILPWVWISFSVLPPCVWQCLCAVRTPFPCFVSSHDVQNHFWKISTHITIRFKDLFVYPASVSKAVLNLDFWSYTVQKDGI